MEVKVRELEPLRGVASRKAEVMRSWRLITQARQERVSAFIFPVHIIVHWSHQLPTNFQTTLKTSIDTETQSINRLRVIKTSHRRES